MTEELQNNMWTSLSDALKAQLRIDYRKALEAFKLDPRNVRIETHIKFLEKYFGKSNLSTPDNEPTPKFKVDDKVKIVSTNNIALQDKVGIVAEKPEGVSSDLVKVEIPCKSFTYLEPCQLAPYAVPTATEAEDEKIRKAEEELQEQWRVLFDRTINPKEYAIYTSLPDWQSYRMELAAKIAVAMITATQSFDVERVMATTDSIVERLKMSKA